MDHLKHLLEQARGAAEQFNMSPHDPFDTMAVAAAQIHAEAALRVLIEAEVYRAEARAREQAEQ